MPSPLLRSRAKKKVTTKKPATKKTASKKATKPKAVDKDNAYTDTSVAGYDLHASKSYVKNALRVTVKRSGTGSIGFDINQAGSYEFAHLRFHTHHKNLRKQVDGLIEFLVKYREELGEVCDIYDEKNEETAKDRKKTSRKFHKARAAKGK